MSVSIALVCEGISDPPTISALADRAILDGIDWIDSDEIDTHRHYRGFRPTDSFLTWFDINELAKTFRVKSFGHLNEESLHGDGHQARKAMALLIFHTPEESPVDAIILFRDGDREYSERAEAIRLARDNPISPFPIPPIPIIIGVANRMLECWILCGFEPTDSEEKSNLEEEHKKLGFDPRFRAHELTATNETHDRSPKRILRVLTGNDSECERRCVYNTSQETLRTRGAFTGLPEFIDELRERLIAAFR